MPIYRELPIEQDYSSDGSLFSFPKEQSKRNEGSPLIQEPNEDEDIIPDTPSLLTPEPLLLPEDPQSIMEESNESINETCLDSESSSEEEDNNLFLSDSIPVGPNQKTNLRMNILESRENLLKQKDNLVIFVCQNGVPFDNGAKELYRAKLLPQFKDIMYERAKISTINNKTLIALPIKLNDRILIEAENVKNCLRSLLDVITELQLNSFSIRKTENFDGIPWTYVLKQLTKHLQEIPINVTICKGLIQTPTEDERLSLISEIHSSAIGGHKGVTKTYNRLRPHFYWNTMKKDIQNFIQKCRQCQLKKLTRIKTKQPMIITDTPGSSFDKISLDIMGPLPITPRLHINDARSINQIFYCSASMGSHLVNDRRCICKKFYLHIRRTKNNINRSGNELSILLNKKPYKEI